MNDKDAPGKLPFKINQSKDATKILDNAEKLGLHDIKEWITLDALQSFLNLNKWIAFIATNEATTTEVVGIAVMGIEEEARLWIETLVTAPKYRRLGIATKLCDAMVNYGKEHSLRVLFVDLDDDNIDAYRFYKKYGFSNAGSISNFYYDSSKAIILSLKLS